MRAAKSNQSQSQQSQPSEQSPLSSSYKQLDISEVLYLIVQQIGFPDHEYWLNMSHTERALFPQWPLIENAAKKGKRGKLFDDSGGGQTVSPRYQKRSAPKQQQEQEQKERLNESESES